MKRRIVAVVAAGLLIAGTSFAQRPGRNVGAGKHPNLAAAQRLVAQTVNRITAAQQANEWDLGGHAQKAKELLEQANSELKLAVRAANK